MENLKQPTLNPLPGFVLAIIEDTQMTNVNFKGDDKFDLPQTGTLIKLNKDDQTRTFNQDGATFNDLIGKRITWAKYAESDCLIYDNNLGKDVVIISIDKLRGYEE